MKVEVTQIEAFTIGPEDKLLIRVPATDYIHAGLGEQLANDLANMGLEGRALIVAADPGELELAVWRPTDDPVIPTRLLPTDCTCGVAAGTDGKLVRMLPADEACPVHQGETL